MQTFTRIMVGTVAAGAMAVSAASPALARDHRGGVDAGDVIAGALVIGGIAAIAASASNNDRDQYRYDGRWDRRYDDRYGRHDGRGAISQRYAVDRCVAAATRAASRYSYGGQARVTDIRDVERKSYGYKVKGNIAVNGSRHHWRGYDAGKFSCKVDRRGHVADLDFKGIRGL
jgi:predicted secreted protein